MQCEQSGNLNLGLKQEPNYLMLKHIQCETVKGVREVPGHLTSKTVSAVGSGSRAGQLAVFLYPFLYMAVLAHWDVDEHVLLGKEEM